MDTNNQIEKKIQITYIVSVAILVAIMIVFAISCRRYFFDNSFESNTMSVSMDFVCMIVCSALVFSLVKDKPWDRHNRSLFRLVFSLCLLVNFDALCCIIESHAKSYYASLFANTFLYFGDTLIIYCFWAYILEELSVEKKELPILRKLCIVTLFIDAIIDILNLKYGFYFYISQDFKYVAGNYERYSEITSFIIYIIIWAVVLRVKHHSKNEKIILLSFQIFPMIAKLLGVLYNYYSLVYPAYLFSIMLIYINVFSARSKKVIEQEREIERQSTALMVSQIQPHFLYNVLTTISNLCVTDPEEAEETTVLFSQYLRTNLDSLRKTEPVPFSVELGHIRTYVELEKKRFKDKLNYEIDCPETNFLVPALGLQPIVENSIKHGIRGKDSPGHLVITSRKVDGGVEVIIKDDGIGFDMNAPLPEDGRSHVGMANVKSRLEKICKATMKVESAPNEGCVNTIFFPEIK